MPARHPATRARVWQRVLPLLASFSLSLSFAARAATFPNLYSVTVNQDPAAADQRAAATGAAFRRRARASHRQPLRGTRSRARSR